MLNKFNSGHNREAKSLYKMISVQVPRPLQIPESGEITPLSSFRKAVFLPFTVVVNGLATIVATQLLQLGAVSANTLSYLRLFSQLSLLLPLQLLLLRLNSEFLPKWPFLTFLRNMTSSLEILKI